MMMEQMFAFPTPALPGSGSKGRPVVKDSQPFRLPQLHDGYTIRYERIKVNGFLPRGSYTRPERRSHIHYHVGPPAVSCLPHAEIVERHRLGIGEQFMFFVR